ncbi:methenyltetrahydromethanopterin cyclohydrolase [Segnochrobactrum spirostomi]|nr:methenyltetrahydromethanopterin cyclohydrolase [Segnochrobactrum spirostomi]
MSVPLQHDRPVPSVSRGAAPLVEALVRDAELLRLSVSRGALGERLVDAGAKCLGSIEAGLKIAEICLGGLGRVTLSSNSGLPNWPFAVEVRTSDPVIACLGSQYAGWSLSHSEGETNYFVLGSGPGRAVAAVEELYGELGFRDTTDETVLVLEADAPPPAPLVAHIAEQLGLAPERITFIYAPTWSLAGGTQVVARVLEVALHKAHTLHFPLEHIVDGLAVAPLSPPVPDFVSAMGRTNDAIIYGGRVQLFVKGPDEEAQSLARRLPSHHSSDHGEPFADIFKRFGGDFYKIDPMLFSPAAVIVTNVETGRTFRAGALYPDLIDASFA